MYFLSGFLEQEQTNRRKDKNFFLILIILNLIKENIENSNNNKVFNYQVNTKE